MIKPCLKAASVVLTFGVVLYCLPSILPGESDTISPAAEDSDASSDMLTITTYKKDYFEAHLVTFPDGTTMSIDCGYKDAGADITTRSHFHDDHCAECSSGNFGQYNRNNVSPGEIIYSDDDRNITVTVVATNSAVIGEAQAGPYACDAGYENGWSMALLVKYRGFDYLTAGDMDGEIESLLGIALKERGVNVDVFKVSHHGSSTSTSPILVQNILPEYAVISGTATEPAGQTLSGLVSAGVKTIYYVDNYSSGGPEVYKANGDVVITTDGFTYSFSGGDPYFYHGPFPVDETPTPTSTPSGTPTETPTPTATPTITSPPTTMPTAIPSLAILPGALAAGWNFSVSLALTEDITQPFDFYLFVDTPAGPYTLCLDGRVKRGIVPLYRDVSKCNAPYFKMVRPAVRIPAGMSGKTVTFRVLVMQAGKMPPMDMLTGLTSAADGVIMMDKASAMIGPQNPEFRR